MSSTDSNNKNEPLNNSQQQGDDDTDGVNVSMLGVTTQDLGDIMTMSDNNASFHVRKNLKQTFEQANEDPSLRSVADKIAHFEKHAEDSMNPATSAAANSETDATTTAELGVYLRLRPITDDSTSTIQVIPPSNPQELFKVRAHAPEHSHAFKISHRPGGSEAAIQEQIVKEYDFSHVFDETCNQEVVYQQTLRPFLNGVARANQSALLFCYGMTNAGKTFTVTGPEKGLSFSATSDSSQQPKQDFTELLQQQQASWGLVPRALQDLLSLVENSHRPSQTQALFLSYFEIYNEHVYDLLPITTENDNHKHHRHSNNTTTSKSNGIMGTAFKGLALHKITDLEDGLSLIVQAKKNRKSGTNRINRDSSRSHAVCQLRIVTTTTTPNDNNSTKNKCQEKQQHADMWIVDLAGSERFKRTGGARQQEAAIINKSLMTLNRCLTALRGSQDNNNNNNHSTIMIPWRESKLTRLFAAHWMGPYAARTCMVVNVHPSSNDFDETQHVLAYATVARTVSLPNGQQQQQSDSNSNNQKPAAVEYGYDGRRKQTMVQRVAKVIRKLSPKRALKRKADNSNKAAAGEDSHKPRHQPAAKKIKTQKEDVPSSIPASHGVAAMLPNDEHDREMNELKMALSAAQAESSVLQARCNELEEQLESIETEVRNEVAEEMETQMLTMREQYGSMMETLKARLDESNSSMNQQTNNNSEQAVLLERAQSKIRELKEQVAECEDEMKRMHKEHQEEMWALREKYESLLREQGKHAESEELVVVPKYPQHQQQEQVIEQFEIKNGQHGPVQDENHGMHHVDEALVQEPAFQEDIDMAPAEDETYDVAAQAHDNSTNELMENNEVAVGEEANEETRSIDDSVESLTEEMMESDDDKDDIDDDDDEEVAEEDEEQSRPSTTRRLTRLQVRKEGDSDSEKQPFMSSTKNSRSERKPLEVISENVESQNILSDSESSDGSFGPEKWLRPKKGLKKDPATGAFLRPRGRKPKDAEYWDENRGAWRLSDAVI